MLNRSKLQRLSVNNKYFQSRKLQLQKTQKRQIMHFKNNKKRKKKKKKKLVKQKN